MKAFLQSLKVLSLSAAAAVVELVRAAHSILAPQLPPSFAKRLICMESRWGAGHLLLFLANLNPLSTWATHFAEQQM
jgi:hypothetical protein